MAKSKEPQSLQDAGLQPAVGQWYRLLRGYGSGVGMLTASYRHDGQERQRMVQVVDIHEPGTAGTGYVDTASPVVRWHQHTPEGIAVHHLQVHMDQFRQLFAEGSEPAEEAELAAQAGSGGEAS